MGLFNKSGFFCTLMGRVGRELEVKRSQSGIAYTSFPLAISEVIKMPDDNYPTKTLWVNVKAFGKLAETLSNHVFTGDVVSVHGAVVIEEYTTKDGEARTSHTIIASNGTINLLSKKGENSEPASPSPQPKAASNNNQGANLDDDIPF